MNTRSLNRRDFLKTGAATAALAATASFPGSRGLLAAEDYGGKKIPFAIQLYTVGGPWGQDPEGTLDLLAKAGYKGVEFAGFSRFANDAPGLRRALDNAGLKSVGAHVGNLHIMTDEALQRQIEFHKTIGSPWIGVSQTSPAAPPVLIQGLTRAQIEPTGMADTLLRANAAAASARTAVTNATFSGTAAEIKARVDELAAAELAVATARADTVARIQASPARLTREQVAALANPAPGGRGGGGGRGGPQPSQNTKAEWEAVADQFSAMAAKLKPAGLQTYYHCHPGDFNTINGETTWDIFFARASQDVFMQIDLGHMGSAGIDQVTIMKKFPGRARTVHVKPAGGGGRLVGDENDGNLAKWPAIFKACEDPAVGNTAWYILEYDGGSMDMALRTAERLKEWGKI